MGSVTNAVDGPTGVVNTTLFFAAGITCTPWKLLLGAGGALDGPASGVGG